ncbi:MAG: hypothetical protein STSR0006_00290 [Lentimicrobium sp.]
MSRRGKLTSKYTALVIEVGYTTSFCAKPVKMKINKKAKVESNDLYIDVCLMVVS